MSDDDLIQIPDAASPAIIKVIGVGGGGGNAVQQMYRDNIPEVRCLVANTDSKALGDNLVPEHLQMGPGLGAGGDPGKGCELALSSTEEIQAALDDGTQMVFITAGMGGGTGTGASPVIAREAKAKGILTIGIVTLPFLFEGNKQIDKALDGLERLSKEVDAMLVINNERLKEVYEDLNIFEAFKCADRTLSMAVSSITEIISMHGRVNLDFADVRTTLTDGGVAVMATGYGEGENRVMQAINQAIHSPLLNNNDIFNASHILLCITTSDNPDTQLQTGEISEITAFMQKFNEDIYTKWGLALDNSLGGKIKITIVASGFGLYTTDAPRRRVEVQMPDDPERTERRDHFYPGGKTPKKRRPNVFLFSPEDMLNDEIVERVSEKATYRRTREDLKNLQNNSI